jgi:cytochrome c peroxidase
MIRLAAALALVALVACERPSEPAAPAPEAAEPATPAAEPAAAQPQATQAVPLAPDRAALIQRAQGVFKPLPKEAASAANPVTEEKIALGRMLYYDPRLSKAQEIDCNDCHMLDRFGVDNEPTSRGHKGQRGARNSPSAYNAALHVAQFWDGRAADVEAQAKGPMMNPIEMGMASEAACTEVLQSIPGYAPLFKAAFPADAQPITIDNAALAIAAFERRLLTPSPFDAFLAGDASALSDEQVRGLELFMNTGCTTCHQGVGVGGGMYQKLGLVRAFPTTDKGRGAVTGNSADDYFFKVPSLRNAAKTNPYFHDGSIATLDEAIKTMAAIQLGRDLPDDQIAGIRAFLESLTGAIDTAYIARPALPENGPKTPGPDPS